MYTPTKISEKKSSSHERKHKYDKIASREGSSKQSSKKHLDKKYTEETLQTSPIYNYKKKATETKYVDYDPVADVSEGYNPEYPELFPSTKSVTTKKLNSDAIKSQDKKSSKRKSTVLEETDFQSHYKKHKSSEYLDGDFDSTFHKSTKDKHNGHRDKDKKSKFSKQEDGEKEKVASPQPEKCSDTRKKKDKSSSSKCDKSKSKIKLNSSEEFTSSEVRFEDCLGLNDLVPLKKKKSSKSHSSALKDESSKMKSEKHHKSKESSTSKKEKSLKTQLIVNKSEEFTSSDVGFEDCLGLNDIIPVKKKKSSKSQSATKQAVVVENNSSQSHSDHHRKRVSKYNSASNQEKLYPGAPSQSMAIENNSPQSYSDHYRQKASKGNSALNQEKLHPGVMSQSMAFDRMDFGSSSLSIQPNYKSLPQKNLDFGSFKKHETLTIDDAIRFISSRKEKTAVYSGKKSFFTEVPTLFELCTRVLIENIDEIGYIKSMPYCLIKPVLERCTPVQLFNIENFNPHLLEDTHELWEVHCRREYKLFKPEENETWRELYLRAFDERKKKLKSITANISASMSKSNPVRQVKLAYVDSFVKPPRDVARKQAKHGTARPVNSVTKSESSAKETTTPKLTVFSEAPKQSTSSPKETFKQSPSSSKETSKQASTSSASAVVKPPSYNAAKVKPKVAPLMAKTLKSLKHFRR